MEDRGMVTPTPISLGPAAVWSDPTPPPAPDFAASESAAINLVAAWEWFREARDIIVAATKARRVLTEHETLVATLEGHANDLQRRIGTMDGELADRVALVEAQRAALAAQADRENAALSATLTAHAERVATQVAALDSDFARYRDGEAAQRRADLNASMDALALRRDTLLAEVGELEAKAAAAQAQIDLVRSMIGKG